MNEIRRSTEKDSDFSLEMSAEVAESDFKDGECELEDGENWRRGIGRERPSEERSCEMIAL